MVKLKKMTKVGIIGFSKGNGHPFSFSAIINGYSQEEMDKSIFPGIANYLSVRDESEFGIGDWKVTHLWTPNKEISQSISRACRIENICDSYQQFIDHVDIVLLARDDADSHRGIAQYFIERNVKVFIDKPLCNDVNDLDYFIPFLKSGQVASCSGLRYFPPSSEFNNKPFREDLLYANCSSPIEWFKYGIHLLECIQPVFNSTIVSVQNIGNSNLHAVKVDYESGKHAMIHVSEDLGGGLQTHYFAKNGQPNMIKYNDNFSCFRNQLLAFEEQCRTNIPMIDPSETTNLIMALIASSLSLDRGGVKINIKEEFNNLINKHF